MQALLSILLAVFFATQVAAQDQHPLARVDPAQTSIRDGWFGNTKLSIGLSQGVPFRVFLLAAPPRLVIDFQHADWRDLSPEDVLPRAGRVTDVHFGIFQPGWSRLVADLASPMVPDDVVMAVDPQTGSARLDLTLKPATDAAFADRVGVPPGAVWVEQAQPTDPKAIQSDAQFTVVVDPGHGGIDPGAERAGVSEKHLTLAFARTLQEMLIRRGVQALLTRNADVFVALEQRVAFAQKVEADVFISLHADSLSQGEAQGATVYLLAPEASDAASAKLAARHNRSDIIAGADLTRSDDQLAGVLLDLARQETAPRSKLLAETLIDHMAVMGGPMNRRPLRHADFSVLKSADIPSVLVEVGFLSSDRDLDNLRDPVWRDRMVRTLAQAILSWRDLDETRRSIVRR
ncbi:MAG: N-acetylmuramoyl-L-alanine amidase [Pseudomonadota bacterium]